VWDLAQPGEVEGRTAQEPEELELRRAVNRTIKRVQRDLDGFQYNTAVSALMELSNAMQRVRPVLDGTSVWSWAIEEMLRVMAPITPYITEELWHRRGHESSIHLEPWPAYDEAMTIEDVVTVVVQVNGKLRDRLEVPRGEDVESVKEQALASPRVQHYTEGKEILKVVTVPDKLVNVVVR
jgi:leucyl-tRNA synthetase